jgi:hypothetical protein
MMLTENLYRSKDGPGPAQLDATRRGASLSREYVVPDCHYSRLEPSLLPCQAL